MMSLVGKLEGLLAVTPVERADLAAALDTFEKCWTEDEGVNASVLDELARAWRAAKDYERTAGDDA